MASILIRAILCAVFLGLPTSVAFILGSAPASWLRNRPLRTKRRDWLVAIAASISLLFLGFGLSEWGVRQVSRTHVELSEGWVFAHHSDSLLLVLAGFLVGWIYFQFVSRDGRRSIVSEPSSKTVPLPQPEWDRTINLFIAISQLFFVISLPMIAFDSEPSRQLPTTGYVALIFGGFAVLDAVLWLVRPFLTITYEHPWVPTGAIAWLANPLLLVIWRRLRVGRRRSARVCAVLATAMAVSFIVLNDLPYPLGGRGQVTGFELGFAFWVASMVTALVGCFWWPRKNTR